MFVHDALMCVPWLIHVCLVQHIGKAHRPLCAVSMTRSRVCHDSFMCVWYNTSARHTDHCVMSPWLVHACAMTHSYVCGTTHRQGAPTVCCLNDSFICVPWLIHVCVSHRQGEPTAVCMTHSYVCVTAHRQDTPTTVCCLHDSFTRVPLLIHMCVVQHIGKAHRPLCAAAILFTNKGARKVWHDSWCFRFCVMTHSYVSHALHKQGSSQGVAWLIRMCAMTHWYMCHDWFVYVPWRIYICSVLCTNELARCGITHS